MIKSLKSKGLCVILCGALIVGVATGCTSQATSSKSLQSKSTPKPIKEITRVSYEKKAEELKAKYEKNQNDEALRLEYAQTLFTLGDITEAQEILKPLLDSKKPSGDAIYLSSQIEYLNGNYAQAEKLCNTLIKEYPDKFKEKAEDKLALIYYQTNQYQKAEKLSSTDGKVNNYLLEMMKAFEDKQANQIDWNGKNETVIPFVTTDPLPVIPVEINGKRINAIIDSGAPMFVVDEKIAKEIGIKEASDNESEFAGGNTAKTGFGQADSLTIGDVNMKNIPVMLGPFGGFEDGLKAYKDIHGILGTSILKEFVPTMDYPSGQLVLRPRNEVGRNNLNKMLANDKILEEIPFTLASVHFMFGKGSVNQKKNLNYFIDSGLGDEKGAGIILPKETMDSLGIPMPELKKAEEGKGGMGGSDFKEAHFGLSSYGLGNLQMKNRLGYYFTGGVLDYDESVGFFQDGLISHHYLKNYKWSIDFDSMKMTFSNPK
ncbi:TPA: aspartyl protease family protein [Clostridioides difficile]|nr:aspartyl protease family protein [Clostridioides difficile]